MRERRVGESTLDLLSAYPIVAMKYGCEMSTSSRATHALDVRNCLRLMMSRAAHLLPTPVQFPDNTGVSY